MSALSAGRAALRLPGGPVLALAAAALALLAMPAPASTLPDGFQESVVFQNLLQPTAVRFAADGRVFVAEKSGIVKVFDSLTSTTPTVFADLRTNVHNFWDRGLLGLALHPSFPATPYVYVLYTLDADVGGTPPKWGNPGDTFDGCPSPPGPTQDGCVVAARLSRLQAAGDVMTGSEQVLLENWCQQFPSHSIGSLVFGPDGALYVSGGDGASFGFADYGQAGIPTNPCGDPPAGVGGIQTPPTAEGGALRSQDLRTSSDPVAFNGAILRVDPATGAALPDNPLFGGLVGGDDRIIAYGLRNPFRVTVRPGTSEIWIGDVGWNDYEEINRIPSPTAAVHNFGWPCYEGPGHQPGYDAAELSICQNLYAAGPGAVDAPYFSYYHGDPIVPGDACGFGSSAISGVAFYQSGGYPAGYNGALFFADYSRNCISVMAAGAGGLPDPAHRYPFAFAAASPVELQVGPGGDLYYVDINGGTVRRIHYFAGNQPPVAVAHADVTSGAAPLTVHFDGSASSDADAGDTISFAWDLDGDGQYDDSTAVAPMHTYTAPGTYVVGLRVTDFAGAMGFASLQITVDNTPPTATITAPLAITTWRVGDVVAFAGTGTDAQDGMLPPSAFAWSLILHHCPAGCHTHMVQDFAGIAAGTFAAPDHDYPSYLELKLTVTDAGGLTGTTSVLIYPETVALGFASSPPGLTLVVGSGGQTAPFGVPVIIGSANSVSAPSPQSPAGVAYKFSAWSDGGPATHNVTAPATATTYVATFVAACGDGVLDPGEACDDGDATSGDGCSATCQCESACGDGVVTRPCEQCDLGPANCAPGQCCAAGCTSDCRVTGACTGSGGCCVTAADCPAGEGCCGNGTLDAPAEACDDGNLVDGDCCSHLCAVEPAALCEPETCAAMGPHLVAAEVDHTTTVDVHVNGTSERWRTKGKLFLGPGQQVDPDGEPVSLVFSQSGVVLYAPTLPPGSFVQNHEACGRRWTFVDPEADVAGAVGWRTGRVRQGRQAGGAGGCSQRIDFALASGSNATLVTPVPTRVRESLRIGDDCFTALLACRATGPGRTSCASAAP